MFFWEFYVGVVGFRFEFWVFRRIIYVIFYFLGVLLCSGVRLVSGSDSGRLRLWVVEVMLELRRKGSGVR